MLKPDVYWIVSMQSRKKNPVSNHPLDVYDLKEFEIDNQDELDELCKSLNATPLSFDHLDENSLVRLLKDYYEDLIYISITKTTGICCHSLSEPYNDNLP